MSPPTLTLETLPRLDGPIDGAAARIRRRGTGLRLDRRTFLKAATVATGAGLTVISWLPPARRALALHNYEKNIYSWPPCPNYGANGFYNNNENGNCNQACGDSTVHSNACFTSGPQNGFHKDHSSGSQLLWSLRPNACYASEAPAADGWSWKVTSTCGCTGGNGDSLHRCHDGNHNHGTEQNPDWHKSICQTRTGCSPTGENGPQT